ncbi:hypothetical protein JB92DRAFT_2932668 [Gautieria morchelliformis]|nr:hypothetical protein JB92DRAFT_2932668 [Gautieria morchelliformis]
MRGRLVWTRALLETIPRWGWACVLLIASLGNSHRQGAWARRQGAWHQCASLDTLFLCSQ